MPIYELKCPKCDKVYEILCSYDDKKKQKCKKCKKKLETIVSKGVNFEIKGSCYTNGWN